ncbi:MAG TPA: AMP-binding protein [Pseudomonas xinjiangensis]|uniref:AMP-binding protein n=2 Tax=root TaxID=1 RepID=A0A7V1BPW1_9GAMM|nr:AMP-binding protein [Halopseudomonas xinjiangensis]HEC49414.1 AMP-binding protein [Halopseudomonas xinjiangensis]
MGDQVKLAVSTALEAFYEREQAHPDKVYLTQPLADGQLELYTWGQVGDQARRVASYLTSLDFPEASHIAIFSRNCAHWLIADLAIWMAGHVSVPVYPTLSSDAVRQMLEHSECRAVFIGKLDEWQQVRSGVRPDIPWIGLPLAPQDPSLQAWQSLLETNEPMAHRYLPDPHQLATIVYTSGATGVPKGVMLSFGSMFHSANTCLRLFTITEDDRLLSYLPLSNIGERQFVEIASLLSGQSVYFVHSSETFSQDIQRARPTVFFSVPRIWLKLHQAVLQKMPAAVLDTLLKIPLVRQRVSRRILIRLGLNDIRYAVSGAAPIPDSLIAWYQRLGMNLVEIYGMTENCGYSHLGRPKRFKAGWIGLPNPGVECRLAEDGEILVRSQANMLGYFKEPVKTSEAINEDGFLHTGDIGEIDKEGFLRITGRKKDIFKTSKGRYVAPAPIEKLLASNPLVEQVCVVGNNLHQPIALVQLAGTDAGKVKLNDNITEQMLSKLLAEVNSKLSRHEQLGCLVIIPDIWNVQNGFMTPTFKVRRAVVEATYRDQVDLWSVCGKTVVWHEPSPA